MDYVDFNPVRAGMAKIPEDSQYTSIRECIFGEFEEGSAIQLFEEDLIQIHPSVEVHMIF